MIESVGRPLLIAWMPTWPGAKRVIELAIAGARELEPVAVGTVFPDRSRLIVEYQIRRFEATPREVYETLGAPPLLSILAEDHGAGIRVVHEIAERVTPNWAENMLVDIVKVIGKDRPCAVVGKSIEAAMTRRRYWWKLEA